MPSEFAHPWVFPPVFPDVVRLLFVDIDGVLNSDTTRPNGFKPLTSQSIHVNPEKIVGIDRRHIQILNRVVAATGAWLVISSSWRTNHGLEETKETMCRAGFVGHILGGTPDVGPHREQDVLAFLGEWDLRIPFPISSYVILDDGKDLGSLEPKLVLTDSDEGMTEQDADQAIHRLLG